jgi:hypothetical protein
MILQKKSEGVGARSRRQNFDTLQPDVGGGGFVSSPDDAQIRTPPSSRIAVSYVIK